MTVDELLAMARDVQGDVWHDRLDGSSPAARLAKAVTDLLAEDARCGFESPCVTFGPRANSPAVHIPGSWCGASVSSDDARALARALMRTADECDAKWKESK